MKKIKLLLALVVFIGILLISLTGCTTTTSTQGGDLILVSDKKTTDQYGTIYIEGEVKNNSDKTYSYAQITFNLYDADGAQLGSAMDNINNLEPNGTWKYKALAYSTEDIATYKFIEITGW